MSPVRLLLPVALAALLAAPAATATSAVQHEEAVPPSRVVPAGAKPDGAAKMCGVCHSDIRVKYARGVHRSEGIGCVSCHGGDPDALTVEGAHRGGYRGVPSRRGIPALCASCHADVARMRFFNIPSDQYAIYQTSQHGIRLAKGDDRAAVCTDCHGVHEIRPTDDPKSSVFRRNIPATCGKCHSDPALLKRYGLKSDPVADYNASVHGKAFLAGGNNAVPECTRCHGSHGASPPGVGDVDRVCGQCHTKTRGYFVASAHKEGMDRAGEPECGACHGYHRIEKATAAMLDTLCAKCHDRGDDALRLAATYRRMVDEASKDIARADEIVAEAARIPLYVEDYRARLEDARTALMESAPVMHSLDSMLVEPHVRRARSIATGVTEEVREKFAGRVWRYVGLGLFWFYLLLTATIVTRARRRAAAERDR
jgi:predicted CXXCH cytochrome family protein